LLQSEARREEERKKKLCREWNRLRKEQTNTRKGEARDTEKEINLKTQRTIAKKKTKTDKEREENERKNKSLREILKRK